LFASSIRNFLRSTATRWHVVRHSPLLMCVSLSQSARHVFNHSATRASISLGLAEDLLGNL
jgi:hypothetical protein